MNNVIYSKTEISLSGRDSRSQLWLSCLCILAYLLTETSDKNVDI